MNASYSQLTASPSSGTMPSSRELSQSKPGPLWGSPTPVPADTKCKGTGSPTPIQDSSEGPSQLQSSLWHEQKPPWQLHTVSSLTAQPRLPSPHRGVPRAGPITSGTQISAAESVSQGPNRWHWDDQFHLSAWLGHSTKVCGQTPVWMLLGRHFFR